VSFAFGAVLAWPMSHEAIDWQPSLAWTQPWRAFTAVFVHYSALHLAANLAGAVLVGALGHAVPVPPRCALAWLAAWPLTQLGLAVQAELIHYGGLSGVLHAGVVVVAVHLLFVGTRTQRRIGWAILAVLGFKVLREAPWEGALRHPEGWDIAVAPLAHATGAIAGAICGTLAEWRHRMSSRVSNIAR
jgi:rhomboid family GlyGly-CTERM serine protease